MRSRQVGLSLSQAVPNDTLLVSLFFEVGTLQKLMDYVRRGKLARRLSFYGVAEWPVKLTMQVNPSQMSDPNLGSLES